MTDSSASSDRLRAILVLAATVVTIAFNVLSSLGQINGITPADISNKYLTPITPAGYAFSIWSLIYLGLIAFSVYQLLPTNLAKYRNLRELYILSCLLNCSWIYAWHHDQIAVCFLLILLLVAVLFLINSRLRAADTPRAYWLVKAPFAVYFGWVTAAALVNFAILLAYLKVGLSPQAWNGMAITLIATAAILGLLVRFTLSNYLYPLAIAWALTAIAVKQSGNTAIVVSCAFAVIACLIAALSFVVNLPSHNAPRTTAQ